MNVDLADIGALLFVFTPFALLLVRIFVVPDGVSLDDLVVPRIDFEWPRGVQEEEPVRWQIERLTPRDKRVPERTPQPVATHAASGPRSASRPGPSVGDRSSKPAS